MSFHSRDLRTKPPHKLHITDESRLLDITGLQETWRSGKAEAVTETHRERDALDHYYGEKSGMGWGWEEKKQTERRETRESVSQRKTVRAKEKDRQINTHIKKERQHVESVLVISSTFGMAVLTCPGCVGVCGCVGVYVCVCAHFISGANYTPSQTGGKHHNHRAHLNWGLCVCVCLPWSLNSEYPEWALKHSAWLRDSG